jgi:FKBP-type peptidyl-prolyl cis-trans isomerase 2
MPIKEGNKVKLDYEGSFDDGRVFDSSKHGDHSHPLEFEVGKKQVIPGFEKAAIGMEKGEEKNFRIESNEAYGQRNPELMQKIPRSALPQDQEPKPGMMLIVGMQNGTKVPAMIAEVTDSEITLDLNHPLAGKALNFKIKIVDYS